MTDTELMDLLAPTDEQKAALHARDMQHCPQTALEGTVLPGVKFYYEGKADKMGRRHSLPIGPISYAGVKELVEKNVIHLHTRVCRKPGGEVQPTLTIA